MIFVQDLEQALCAKRRAPIRPILILFVFLPTALYAGLALFVATRLFERESILFRT